MSPSIAQSQQFYFNANCVSQIELEEQCNASFIPRSMSARFDTGRATKIKYNNNRVWNYTDSRTTDHPATSKNCLSNTTQRYSNHP